MTGWTELQRNLFLRSQFDLQTRAYRTRFSEEGFQLVLLGDEPVGRFYVARLEQEFRVVDLAILERFQNRGIGSALLRELQEEAAAAGLPVCLTVEQSNRARRLYDRLGFRSVGADGAHVRMEWTAMPAK